MRRQQSAKFPLGSRKLGKTNFFSGVKKKGQSPGGQIYVLKIKTPVDS
jgi:hypothetical protein